MSRRSQARIRLLGASASQEARSVNLPVEALGPRCPGPSAARLRVPARPATAGRSHSWGCAAPSRPARRSGAKPGASAASSKRLPSPRHPASASAPSSPGPTSSSICCDARSTRRSRRSRAGRLRPTRRRSRSTRTPRAHGPTRSGRQGSAPRCSVPPFRTSTSPSRTETASARSPRRCSRPTCRRRAEPAARPKGLRAPLARERRCGA